jgi:hypothetical protein
MAETQIRFEDGRSYEQYMGDWSRRVGTVFIDWLAPPSGLIGSMSAAVTVLLLSSLLNGARRTRSAALIHPRPNSILRANGLPRG